MEQRDIIPVAWGAFRTVHFLFMDLTNDRSDGFRTPVLKTLMCEGRDLFSAVSEP